MNNKILVEVGCGESPKPGYIHCDTRLLKSVDYVCSAWALPFKEETVDEIYARHVLEHLTYKKAIRTIKHWLCILKVGGSLDINVPDLEKHIEQFRKDGFSPYVSFKATNREHAMAGFYGWQKNDYDIHKWGYTFETLSKLLTKIGYSNIRRIEDNSTSAALNLRVIAEKNKSFSDLRLDPESLRLKLAYYNWKRFFYRLKDKLKSKKFIFKMFCWTRSLIKRFKKDYSGKGERQASADLSEIRPDHVGRYKFAHKYMHKNDIVLDCACGVGYGSFIIARENDLSSIIAVDKDKHAIKFAKKHYRNDKITYREGDIFSLDIPDNHFDSIVSFETVEHVDGPALLQLFHKKLKVGGFLIISSPNQNTMLFNKKQFPFHLRHYTPSEFGILLTSQGFEITKKGTQYDIKKEEVLDGWDGLFNIAVARKPKANCV